MPTLRDTYCQGLAALLAAADRLGSTPDDIAARAVVLAELRHAIAAGLGEEADVQPKPARVRLVWGREGSIHYLAPAGVDMSGAYYSTAGSYVYRYPCGGEDHDCRVPVSSLAEGLRVMADMARADGYECDEHPDAAPATNADAPTLPHGLSDEDGWIAWGGGECPCRDWPEVEVKWETGDTSVCLPLNLNWGRDGLSNILAYRRPR